MPKAKETVAKKPGQPGYKKTEPERSGGYAVAAIVNRI
jgi:hypothetical protein